jgi:hypothetical protein
MRAQEFTVDQEKIVFPNVFPDGDLKITGHFRYDRADRNIIPEMTKNMCKRFVRQYRNVIPEIEDNESFIIENPNGVRLAILKNEQYNQPGRYTYLVKTGMQDLHLSRWRKERVFKIS